MIHRLLNPMVSFDPFSFTLHKGAAAIPSQDQEDLCAEEGLSRWQGLSLRRLALDCCSLLVMAEDVHACIV